MGKTISPSQLRELLDKGLVKIEVDPRAGKDLLADDVLKAIVKADDEPKEPYGRVFDRQRDPYDRFHDRTDPYPR